MAARISLAAVLVVVVSGCGLEDAPLAGVDISDLQKTSDTAVTQSAEGGAGQTPQAAQQNTTTAAPTTEPNPTAPPAAQTPVPAAGSSSSSDVTVEITENGFGGVPKGFTLTLKKGPKYRIKFVNSDTTGDNVHIIAFSGLNLPEIQLTPATPSETVELSADVPGRYGFSCQNQWCTIHPKVRGTLVIEE